MEAQRDRPYPDEREGLKRPIFLDGTLVLTVDDHDCTVTAAGSELTVEVPSALALSGSIVGLTNDLARARQLSSILEDGELTLTITREGKTLARLGAGAKSGIVGRLLGIPHAELFPKE